MFVLALVVILLSGEDRLGDLGKGTYEEHLSEIIEPVYVISKNVVFCVDSDEPVQPPFKLRNSKWCSVSS